ncbi:flagellar hook-associated protein [Siccibacter turicensis]|uniref:Flagellar hook-associated protein n=1 Tax=Siccibacter turicensis TaxID=357233 RepID=A0A2P8VK67_9ENTR|nr:flagellar hook-associated protein [Siccibacter turicensis]PSN07850.1 flagellar hook-associated protein [Siccibacter turicensis]
MQISLNTAALSSQSTQGTNRPLAPGRAAPVKQQHSRQENDYPASPLLSTRPQRYSVQLNDQLTTQQQADRYLATLEQKLLDYRQSSQRGSTAAGQHVSDLQRLLTQRASLSGGSVDNQLNAILQGEARVQFQSPELTAAVNSLQPEALLFSVQQGRQTLLSAITVSEETDPRQHRTAMHNALRRVGVQLHDESGTISFSSSEKQWPDIQRSLSAMGQGIRFPAGDVKTLSPVSDTSLTDKLQHALTSGGQQGQAVVQQVLGQISHERQKLSGQQEKVRRLIDDMSRFSESQNAVQAASTLAGSLEEASHNYQLLAEAVNGHARFSSSTVQNLLR